MTAAGISISVEPGVVAAPPRPEDDQASGLRRLFAAMRQRRTPDQGVRAPVRRCPVVAIASGKGGVGKTTLAVNIAVSLAGSRRVTLLDADPGLANADVLLGMSPRRRLNRSSLFGDGSPSALPLASLAEEAPGGFRLVPGSVGADALALEEGRSALVDGLASLEAASDLVLIDCGAGIGRLTVALMAAADLGVVVTTPEPTALSDAYALIKLVVRGGYAAGRREPARGGGGESGGGAHTPLGLVVNCANDRGEADRVHGRVRGVAQTHLGYAPEVIGSVRFDPRVGDACRRRRPLLLDRPRAQASRDIASVAAAIAARCGTLISG